MSASAAVPVRVEGIRKKYGAASALHDVTLDFPAGGFTTLLGPSGCGKTTLLRIIAGFLEPDAGTVHVGGRDVGDIPPWRRRIGFVFQSYALWPHMTVRDNVAYGLRLRGLARAEIATIFYQSKLTGGNFFLTALPDSDNGVPLGLDFDPKEMARLYEVGYCHGIGGPAWITAPPFENAATDPPRQ